MRDSLESLRHIAFARQPAIAAVRPAWRAKRESSMPPTTTRKFARALQRKRQIVALSAAEKAGRGWKGDTFLLAEAGGDEAGGEINEGRRRARARGAERRMAEADGELVKGRKGTETATATAGEEEMKAQETFDSNPRALGDGGVVDGGERGELFELVHADGG